MGTPNPARTMRQPMPRAVALALVAALGGAGLVHPAPTDASERDTPSAATTPTAATASPATDVDALDLDAALDARDRVSRELDGIEVAIRRTNDEVAALDVALIAASTELAAITTQLDDARVVAAAAAEAERVAAADLQMVDTQLDVALTSWHDDRSRLADRAVRAYKHGATSTPDVLLRGVTGANDWNVVAGTLETVNRLTADDTALVAAAATSTRDNAALRAEAARLRGVALEAAREATREAARVEDLLHAQQRTADEVAATRDERRTVLATLERDATARAVLVAALDDRVASLELAVSRALIPIAVDLDPFGPPPAWATSLPGDGPRWGAAIEATASRHGLDPKLLAALVWTESNFRTDAVSHAGALGLSQLMPGTARGLGVDPRDPLANLDGGARYLRSMLDQFGRVDLALAAYNAGPGRVQRVGRIPDIVETQLYVVRVLERYERLGG